ncbi:unnamed protein product [Moneuplotes crassus]|uniref:Uncharacterized protein n=1 Tax=Euplotes crassus TaxID=5936 RepID=A0AAD1UGJ4_EUPCR|nr:unnamed protein product [Moneuplotes crassus]
MRYCPTISCSNQAYVVELKPKFRPTTEEGFCCEVELCGNKATIFHSDFKYTFVIIIPSKRAGTNGPIAKKRIHRKIKANLTKDKVVE